MRMQGAGRYHDGRCRRHKVRSCGRSRRGPGNAGSGGHRNAAVTLHDARVNAEERLLRRAPRRLRLVHRRDADHALIHTLLRLAELDACPSLLSQLADDTTTLAQDGAGARTRAEHAEDRLHRGRRRRRCWCRDRGMLRLRGERLQRGGSRDRPTVPERPKRAQRGRAHAVAHHVRRVRVLRRWLVRMLHRAHVGRHARKVVCMRRRSGGVGDRSERCRVVVLGL
mmetsp:Transcript_8788/g.35917  ORF Transcript_8788/g.35917 Transcript_8788/m.35917 type:complete len:225 (-) Transcript_8788:430-1104(-)